MNLFIYVLFLSIWTTNCLNISTTNGSSTAGGKPPDLDTFKNHVLKTLFGIATTVFLLTCFYLIHYNCMIEPVPQKPVKKEESEAKLSRLSILPLSESKTKNLNVHSSEKLALLPNTKNLSRPSTPEKLSIPSSEENLIRPSRYKKSFRAPSITVLLKSPKPKKPRKARLEKACKPAPPHKQAAQAGSSSAVKPVRAPSLTSLQSPGKPAKLSYPENQVLPPMSPSLKKLAKPPKHHNLKMSKSVGEAGTVFTPPSATTCQYYKERCLVCKTSECLLNSTSKEKKENTGYLPVSGEMMPLSRSFHKVDSCNHAYFANMSNGDMIDESNDDSDREITMFCNLTSRDIFPKGTPK